WLERGDGKPDYIEEPVQEDEFIEIKQVAVKLTAGTTGFVVDYANEEGERIMFRKSWLNAKGYKADRLFATKIKGQSMESGLYEDDVVIFNAADTDPVDGKVFAVNYEGECIVKRLIRDNNAWWLESDNPDKARFPRKYCTSTTMIIGRVVHKQSEHI
ncbi:MAG: S24 family peptidase, partial [Pseudomonadota bacterium]